MTALTRKEFLGAKIALRTERVPAPEFGDSAEIVVQEMTVAAREVYSDGLMVEDPNDPDEKGAPRLKPRIGQMYARLAAFSIVDENGKLQFVAPDEAGLLRLADDDLNAICAMPSVLIERVAKAAQRVSGISEASAEAARKNSPAGPSAGS